MSSESGPVTSTLTGRLRDDADFRRYWAARIASLSGSIVTAVAMPVLIYRLTASPGLTALTTTLEALPYLVVGLLAGALADRLDRKRVMVVADLLNVLVVGSVPLAWWLGVLTVPHVLVAAFCAQLLFTFFDGANFGALPVLVGRARVGEANAAIWGFGGVLDLLMPAAAGALLAVLHPADLLAVDALSYAVSAMLVRSIGRALSVTRGPGPPLRPRGVWGDVVDGTRFLWGHARVRSNTIVGALQSVAGAGFMALVVPWADRVLHIGTSGWWFGVLYSVWGIGGIGASAMTPRLLRRVGAVRLTLLAMPVSAVAGIAVAASTHWLVASALMAFWGLAYQLVIINALNYRQEVTPEHLLSRVNTAARMLSWGLGWTVGATAAGALAQVVGVRTAMLTMVCCAVVAVVFGWLSPLRDASSLPAPDEV